jgi:hypothetical protein
MLVVAALAARAGSNPAVTMISRQRWQSIGLISHPAIFDHKVPAFNVAGLVQTSPEAGQPGRVGLR